jgi:hypothetical protein
MGLFDKLFGSTTKDSKTKLRDQFKDEKYFKNEIIRFTEIINDLSVQPNLTAFNYWSISSKFQRIISLRFSAGTPVSELVKDYGPALDNYVKGWEEKEATYADILLMISLGILFETSTEDFNRLVAYVEKTDNNKQLDNWKPDSLLWFLLNSRAKTENKGEGILFPPVYQPLYEITRLPKEAAEKAAADYMNNWYKMHKDDPWFNAHLKDRGYGGYWAWEVAAVVKVMGLDDSSFKDHPYYPYDMVHWKD